MAFSAQTECHWAERNGKARVSRPQHSTSRGCSAKLQSPLSGWAGGSKPRAGSLGRRRAGDQGIQHNHRGETKSKRQNKRKYVLKLEGNQSERHRCGQVEKR